MARRAANIKPGDINMAQLMSSGALATLGLKLIAAPTKASPIAQYQITDETVEAVRQLVGRMVNIDTDGFTKVV